MEIKLHQLEIVLCIARELSFSKPAEKLGISQPGIRPNKNLEDSWVALKFCRLIDRSDPAEISAVGRFPSTAFRT